MKYGCGQQAVKRYGPFDVEIGEYFRRRGLLIDARALKKSRDTTDDKCVVETVPGDFELRLNRTGQPNGIRVQLGLTQQVKWIGMKSARHESLNYIAGGGAGDAANDTQIRIDVGEGPGVYWLSVSCSGSRAEKR